eukprot:5422759-Pyramimonas_sp.AAC.1
MVQEGIDLKTIQWSQHERALTSRPSSGPSTSRSSNSTLSCVCVDGPVWPCGGLLQALGACRGALRAVDLE